MTYYKLFLDVKLPKQFSQEELYDYFKEMERGDITAREKIITHNIRLVLSIVENTFLDTPYDKKELVAIGLIGLIKSVDTFDLDKGFKFATYSSRCITNEILMFLRHNKNHINRCVSLDQIIIGNDGTHLKLEDILFDDNADFVSEYEMNELYNVIGKIVNELSEKNKNIVIKYFSFMGKEPMKQSEIASEG